jgi:hypothetical protein
MRRANSKAITTSLTDEEGGESCTSTKTKTRPNGPDQDEDGKLLADLRELTSSLNQSVAKGEASELTCPLIMKSGVMVKIDDF